MGKRMESVTALLDELGAKLKREKKHRVYELPNGRNFVVPSTPSDSAYAERNALSDLRKAAGIKREPKERREVERREKQGRHDSTQWSVKASPMAAALSQSGIVEEQYRSQSAELESLREQIDETEQQLVQARRRVFAREEELRALKAWWPCRLRTWLMNRCRDATRAASQQK